MKPSRSSRHACPRASRGFSLLVILIMVIVLAFIALGAMNTSLLQERMAGNANDQSIALQAAEAALRDAEQDIEANIRPGAPFADGCANGLCGTPSMKYGDTGTSKPVWETVTWSDGSQVREYGSKTAAPALTVAEQPRYIIEQLYGTTPPGCSAQVPPPKNTCPPVTPYRITVRATGQRDTTVVMLQSVYIKQ